MPNDMKRPTWNEYFLNIAREVAQRGITVISGMSLSGQDGHGLRSNLDALYQGICEGRVGVGLLSSRDSYSGLSQALPSWQGQQESEPTNRRHRCFPGQHNTGRQRLD